jgi:putative Mg2+ transporter-C (MgtC) family protein
MMVSPFDIALRLGTSVVLGGVIGHERGRHDHPAGLRTHTLVSLAATLFMILSSHALHVDRPIHPGVTISFDPTRIASYVVAGIGFLGGGAIARTGLTVKGLTTAASLWLVTAIGLSVGAGLYFLAVVGTVLGYGVLSGFRYLEHKPEPRIKRIVRLEVDGSTGLTELLDWLRDAGILAKAYDIDRDLAAGVLALTIDLDHSDESDAIPVMASLEGLSGLRKITMTHRPPCG